MKKQLSRFILVAICFVALAHTADAQKKRSSSKRATTRKTTKGKPNARVKQTAQVDTVAAPVAVVAPPPPPPPDTLPIPNIKKSLRRDEAVITDAIRDRTPLTY